MYTQATYSPVDNIKNNQPKPGRDKPKRRLFRQKKYINEIFKTASVNFNGCNIVFVPSKRK